MMYDKTVKYQPAIKLICIVKQEKKHLSEKVFIMFAKGLVSPFI